MSTKLLFADVNECDMATHDCDMNAYCNNTIGSYNCTCNEGYSGEGSSGTCEGMTLS